MDQSDVKYIIELISEAITNKNWDDVDEALETLKEFLDTDESQPSE